MKEYSFFIRRSRGMNVLTIETYRSPYDPDAILFSNFKCLGSISHTSVPSLGIVKWSGSHFVTVWSSSPTETDGRAFGQACLWIATPNSTLNYGCIIYNITDAGKESKEERKYGFVIWNSKNS